jgi:phosphoglucomutase
MLLTSPDSLLSTPAASHLIRSLGLDGAFLLTASHNPGGPEEDFGIKFNCANGGPAPERVTTAIYESACVQTKYTIVQLPEVDLGVIGVHEFNISGKTFTVEVVDGVDAYCKYMSEVFLTLTCP